MINGNNQYWQNAAMNIRKDGDEWRLAKDTVSNTYTSEDEGKVVSDGELISQTSSSTTSNGTIDTTTINSLEVNVANSYSQADNGKVVNNQELVAQTAYPTEITENDTYDTTNYNSITVNVSGGGGNAVILGIDGDPDFSYTGMNQLLRSIVIPDNIEYISYECFSGCTNLSSVTFANINNITAIEGQAFNDCESLTSIVIPPNVSNIGDAAFSNCSSLTSITIPNGVTTIGQDAFYGCTALENVTFEPTTPPELYGDLSIPTTCIIRVPQGTLSDYTSASNYPDPSEYTYEEY